MIRSISGIDRQATCNYVVLPPGMSVVAAPARTPCLDKADEPMSDNTIITTGVMSSLLVFLMWVGAWGMVDTIIVMLTDVPLYQLGMYSVVLIFGALGVWLQLADWRRSQEEAEADLNV